MNSKEKFIIWLRKNWPDLYKDGLSRIYVPVALGEAEETALWADKLISIIEKIAPVYAGVSQAKALLKINIERAKAGLPPLETSDLSPQVNVGVSQGVERMGYVGIAVIAGIGLLAYVLLKGR